MGSSLRPAPKSDDVVHVLVAADPVDVNSDKGSELADKKETSLIEREHTAD